jgi:hypothetical protein
LDVKVVRDIFQGVSSVKIFGKIDIILDLIDVLEVTISVENPAVALLTDRNVNDSAVMASISSGGIDHGEAGSVWCSVGDTVSVVNLASGREEHQFSILGTGDLSRGIWSGHSGPSITSELVVLVHIGVVDELVVTRSINVVGVTVGAVSNINGLSWGTSDSRPFGSSHASDVSLSIDVLEMFDIFSPEELSVSVNTVNVTISTDVEGYDVMLSNVLRLVVPLDSGVVPEAVSVLIKDLSSLSEPEIMGLINSPDNGVLSDGSLSESTGNLGPTIRGLLPDLMSVIDSNDLLVTGRDSNELFVLRPSSMLPLISSDVGGRGVNSLVDLVVFSNSPNVAISDITDGNIEELVWSEVLPVSTLRHGGSDTGSHGGSSISFDNPEVSSVTTVNSLSSNIIDSEPIASDRSVISNTSSQVEVVVSIED